MDISRINLDEVARRCVEKLFSGRDIANLCQQAIWNMIREENRNLAELSKLPYEEIKSRELRIRPLEPRDFYRAFEKVKVSLTKDDISKYERWRDMYGE